jgi:hypothetical protein
MASSSVPTSASERLNRACYLGAFVLCLLVGGMALLRFALADRSQPEPDATLSVPTDEIAMGLVGLVLWLGVLAAVGWWALRSYRRLGGSAVAPTDSGR